MSAKIKLNAASGGGSVSITAPSSTTGNANVELKLPIADGSSEQVIKTDGSGNLSFGQAVTAKNLVTNGAMIVAQRGVSSTASGYATVDRFKWTYTGTDEAPTQEQVNVAAGTTPFTKGITKAYKITNGNQTSGAGAGDYIFCDTRLEAQDIRNSGWNYLSSSSFLTLSFYVKSSVAQNFYGYVQSFDGTGRTYPFETGSLSADTWTKITKTIPGNSGLAFDNDNNMGLLVLIAPFWGTNYTDSGVTLNQWGTTNGSARTPDYTSTWYTTNDATFEITGVQLEVGSSASAFVSESYADTLAKCQRYYYRLENDSSTTCHLGTMQYYTANGFFGFLMNLPVAMRVIPTATLSGSAFPWTSGGGANGSFTSFALNKNSKTSLATNGNTTSSSNGSAGNATVITLNVSSYIDASAEL